MQLISIFIFGMGVVLVVVAAIGATLGPMIFAIHSAVTLHNYGVALCSVMVGGGSVAVLLALYEKYKPLLNKPMPKLPV